MIELEPGLHGATAVLIHVISVAQLWLGGSGIRTPKIPPVAP